MEHDMTGTAARKEIKEQSNPGRVEESVCRALRIPGILLILSVICSFCSAVPVSIHCSFYNTEDQLAVSLGGENLDFSGSTLLEQDSLYYSNGGKSTQPNCSYSYSVTFDGEELRSGAQTDSGNFSWDVKAGSNMWHDGSSTFGLSNKHHVKNGTMTTFDANGDHRIDEVIEAQDASYSVASEITPGSMDLKGKGANFKKKFIYSYAQALDDERFGSSAESSAGGAEWKVNVTTGGKDDAVSVATLSAKDFVENGSLASSFFNSAHGIDEIVQADNAYYVESANITHGAIKAEGVGRSRLPEFLYSYAQIFDEDLLGAGASSTSGKAIWSANASSEADGTRSADIYARSFVEDGSFDSQFFNNDHGIEKTIVAEGANYSEKSSVVSSELNTSGVGMTRLPEFLYSCNQTLDTKSMGLGAEGTSASGAWKSTAIANGIDDDTKSASVLAVNREDNGSLRTFYFNPDLSVKDDVEALDAKSMQLVEVSGQKILAWTTGSTISAQNDTDDKRGARQQIQVNESDKWGRIETGIMGDTEAGWMSQVLSNASQYSFGMGLVGRGSLLKLDDLEMVGQASGFPSQVLPGIKVEYQYGSGTAIEEEQENWDDFYRMNMTFKVKYN
jgi:hypothetical protein